MWRYRNDLGKINFPDVKDANSWVPLISSNDELAQWERPSGIVGELYENHREFAQRTTRIRMPEVMPRIASCPRGVWFGDLPGDKDIVSYDIESLYIETDELTGKELWVPICGVVQSVRGWAFWVSPVVDEGFRWQDAPRLIPCPPGGLLTGVRVIAYDRGYTELRPGQFWWDIGGCMLLLHGMSNQQRGQFGMYQKSRRGEGHDPTNGTWAEHASATSLAAMVEYYEGRKIDKSVRDVLLLGQLKADNVASWVEQGLIPNNKVDALTLQRVGISQVRKHMQEIFEYCCSDVLESAKVNQHTFREFLEAAPSWETYAGMLYQSREFMPVNPEYTRWVRDCNHAYNKANDEIADHLKSLADELLVRWQAGEDFTKDPWYNQLDWTPTSCQFPVQRFKDWFNYCQGTGPLADSPFTAKLDLSRLTWKGKDWSQKVYPMLTNGFWLTQLKTKQRKDTCKVLQVMLPAWYKDAKYTLKTRTSPILMNLKYNGLPLVWHNPEGDNAEPLGWCIEIDGELEPVPNPDPLAKGKVTQLYGKHWRPLFQGDNPVVQASPIVRDKLLPKLASVSLFQSYRKRLGRQRIQEVKGIGPVIIPELIPTGTISGRSTDPTFKTIANAKDKWKHLPTGDSADDFGDVIKSVGKGKTKLEEWAPKPDPRIGVYAKSMMQAPTSDCPILAKMGVVGDYCFVGFDIDSQEAWLYSLLGDGHYGIPGATGLGRQVLMGTKANGTDIHTYVGTKIGISRSQAKPRNYARMYGEGLKAAAKHLKLALNISEDEAMVVAEALFGETKGKRGKYGWYGGTESQAFNRLDSFCEADVPRTPALNRAITQALQPRYTRHMRKKWGKEIESVDFITTLANWFIQSSGVDFMALLLSAMEELTARKGWIYGEDYWLAITIHDEVHYVVRKELRYDFAKVCQIAHCSVRVRMSKAFGVNVLPAGVAYASGIDISQVIRKAPDAHCVTEVWPHAVPPGESVTAQDLLDMGI